MEEDWLRLADHVVTERVRRKLDIKDVADSTGVTTRTLRKVEKGERVGRETLVQLELFYQWPPGTARQVLQGGSAPDSLEEPPAPEVEYPSWAAGDPMFEYIYRGPGTDREKLVAIRAVGTHRDAVSGTHEDFEARRA
ncbi:helix-turn-helix domain-containing protein [Actinomadura sp. LOL_016]|uniref:helix-turn-helix domain-containing protein n=1 Tax=unclassified Actinomadura TaxID=2626254 RepID=UPI003A80C7A9